MHEAFLLILLFPLIWPWIAKLIWSTTITWLEMTINVVVVVLLVSGIWFAGKYSETYDYEVWNGEITGKEKLRVSCKHSYACNCRQECSGSGKNRSCYQVCDTCYEHSYDIDWRVYTNVGNFNINRIDRQGLKTPSRWAIVENGQPVATTYPFTNYVKAASYSLFHDEAKFAEQYKDSIPSYPLQVYDYHYLNRVLSVGVPIDNIKTWNWELATILKELGPKKQANIILVFVNNSDSNYVYGLKSAWQGAKKNDIVIVVGVTEYPTIDWVGIISWSKNEALNVNLREDLTDLKTVDINTFIPTVKNLTMDYFVRRPMSEFEYLKDEIEPPTGVVIFAFIFGVVVSIGLTIVFHKNEII